MWDPSLLSADAGRILRNAQQSVLKLLDLQHDRNGTYHRMLVEDVQWIKQYAPACKAMPEPADDFAGCLIHFVSLTDNKCSRLKQQFKTATLKATHFEYDKRCQHLWHRQITNTYRDANLAAPEWSHLPQGDVQYICYECGQVSNSTRAWWNHRANQHGFVRDIRGHIDGEHCLACLTNFHTLPRLIRHISDDSPSCHCYYHKYVHALTSEDLALSKAEYRRVCHEHRKQGLPGNGRTALLDPILHSGPKWPRIDPLDYDLEATLTQPTPLIAPEPQEHVPSPRPLEFDYYLVVHLFSGQRRPGDVQDHLERCIALSSRPVVVLSLDIVNNKVQGDLADGKIVNFWIQEVLRRRVLATIGGPPCESWSAARLKPLSDTRHGPPPLRHADTPWGMHGLSEKLYRQLRVANALMRTMITFLHASYASGNIAVMEHPQYPEWYRHLKPASCWKLPAVQDLRDKPGCTFLDFDQCAVGTAHQKPTTLCLVNAPAVATHIRMLPNGGKCNKQCAHTRLVGLKEDGAFHSSAAKQYNSAFSRTIAAGVCEDIASLIGEGEVPWKQFDASAFASSFVPLDPYGGQDHHAFGADYAEPETRHPGRARPRPDVSCASSPCVPPPRITLTRDQQETINNNRQAALFRKQQRLISRDAAADPDFQRRIVPFCRSTVQTSAYRQRFAFGRTTAPNAKRAVQQGIGMGARTGRPSEPGHPSHVFLECMAGPDSGLEPSSSRGRPDCPRFEPPLEPTPADAGPSTRPAQQFRSPPEATHAGMPSSNMLESELALG